MFTLTYQPAGASRGQGGGFLEAIAAVAKDVAGAKAGPQIFESGFASAIASGPIGIAHETTEAGTEGTD